MNRARLAILGTGNVVRGCHLPAVRQSPRAELVALANAHPDSLHALARATGIAAVSTDFDAIARDPGIDAVVIGLPNFLHAPVACLMLHAGKHVLCEKPMATSAVEAAAMLDAAEQSGKTLMIAHVWRCSPVMQWLRHLVASGSLGTIQRVMAHAVVAGRGPAPASWSLRAETAGGGALADVGIHSIDTISFLFDDRIRPRRVQATIENRFSTIAVEDSASLAIEYDNGIRAEVEAGWYHPGPATPHGAIELFGTAGRAGSHPPRCELTEREPGQDRAIPEASQHPDHDPTIYANQIERFLDCVLDDRPPPCDARQGMADMVVLDAAYRSAATGMTVSLEPVGEARLRAKG
jgi:predicted dehydrogenase